MAKDLFYSLDLNLLRTFIVLTQERNMRKASQRLSVSQPAVSQALQKLRYHLDNELFVKIPSGLEPTTYAIELAESITPHLDGLSEALNTSREFSPEAIDSRIKIALPPMVLTCLSGSLYRTLTEKAPAAQLELVSWSKATPEEIVKGEVLLGINYEMPAPKEVFMKYLVDLKGLVIVRNDHPITKTTAKPEDFVGYGIASMINPGWNDDHSIASRILRDEGYEVKVEFRSELIMALVDVIMHTDMFLPHTNLFPLETYPGLRAIDVEIEPEQKVIPLYSHCHVKDRNSALVKWLHSEIKSILGKQIQN